MNEDKEKDTLNRKCDTIKIHHRFKLKNGDTHYCYYKHSLDKWADGILQRVQYTENFYAAINQREYGLSDYERKKFNYVARKTNGGI